jgi:hypothetical protein
MKRNWLIFCILTLIGAAVGYIVVKNLERPQWERLTSPPPVFVRLIKYRENYLYVVDQYDHLYACETWGVDMGKCTQAKMPPRQSAECALGYVQPTPFPPLPIISQRVDHLCSTFPVRVDTIITGDGSIWTSSQAETDAPLFVYAFRCVMVLFGAIAGMVIFILYRAVVKLRRVIAR